MIIERTPLPLLQAVRRSFPERLFQSASGMGVDSLAEILAKSFSMDLIDAEETALQLATLSRWATTPVLFAFSSELASSLVDAADDSTSLPLDLLVQLAHKCLYIQSAVVANGFDGFFFWINSDLPQPEMVFWFLANDMVQGLGWRVVLNPSVPLSDRFSDVQALCFDLCKKVCGGNTAALGLLDGRVSFGRSAAETVQKMILRGVQLVLYCLSENADIADQGTSTLQEVPGISMQRVSVGQRISDGLSGHSDTRRPATHIRRGHWHSYWVGSKKDAANRRKAPKWVPPILVGENSSKLPKDVNLVADRLRRTGRL